jgi:hypothetical protein
MVPLFLQRAIKSKGKKERMKVRGNRPQAASGKK